MCVCVACPWSSPAQALAVMSQTQTAARTAMETRMEERKRLNDELAAVETTCRQKAETVARADKAFADLETELSRALRRAESIDGEVKRTERFVGARTRSAQSASARAGAAGARARAGAGQNNPMALLAGLARAPEPPPPPPPPTLLDTLLGRKAPPPPPPKSPDVPFANFFGSKKEPEPEPEPEDALAAAIRKIFGDKKE